MAKLTYQDVLRILRLIDEAPGVNLDISIDGMRVKAERMSGVAADAPTRRQDRSLDHEAGREEKAMEPARAPKTAPAAPKPAKSFDAEGAIEVKSPMLGVFYAAPAPGAPPFVKVGDAVKKGDQLGTVEVMKLFTPLLAPADGTVRAILVENEQEIAKDETIILLDG